MEYEEEEELKKVIIRKNIFAILMIIQIIINIYFTWLIIDRVYENNKPRNSAWEEYQMMVTYNAKFNAYEGNYVQGSKIKSLLQNIITNNILNENRDITVSFLPIKGDYINEIITSDNNIQINTDSRYKVTVEYSEEGYINKINIIENE